MLDEEGSFTNLEMVLGTYGRGDTTLTSWPRLDNAFACCKTKIPLFEFCGVGNKRETTVMFIHRFITCV